MHNSTWNVSIPEGYHLESLKGKSISKFKISNFNSFIDYCLEYNCFIVDAFTAFASPDEIFHKGRDKSELATVYSSYISKVLSGFRGSNNVGALIMEPGKIFEIFLLQIIVPFYFLYHLMYP